MGLNRVLNPAIWQEGKKTALLKRSAFPPVLCFCKPNICSERWEERFSLCLFFCSVDESEKARFPALVFGMATLGWEQAHGYVIYSEVFASCPCLYWHYLPLSPHLSLLSHSCSVSCPSFVLASSPTKLSAMGCRPAWIIHEQWGRVAVCCWRVKGGIRRLGVYWGVCVCVGGTGRASARGMCLNSLPLGMCRATQLRRGGWIMAGASVFVPDSFFI